MSRPPLEVADLIRVAGQRFIAASRRWITGQHRKVLAAIERCRTALLPLCFQFLGRPTNLPPTPELPPDDGEGSSIPLPSTSSWPCPQCGGPLIILERFTAAEMCLPSPPPALTRFA